MTENSPLHEAFISAIRARKLISSKFEACRLVDGAADRLPGAFLDKLGTVGILHLHPESSREFGSRNLTELAPVIAGEADLKSLYLRIHGRDVRGESAANAELLLGEALAEFRVNEHGLTYIIRPNEHPHGGFFVDMRDVRAGLMTGAVRGKRVLNLFSFTGSIGIAAWAGGAATVVQVDVSKRALNWSRENLELNPGKGSGEMKFIPEDARKFLERVVRRVERGEPGFDLIVIDPPSFGSSSRGAFSIDRELDNLIADSLLSLSADGELILTVNRRSLTSEDIADRVRDVSADLGVAIRSVEAIHPPKEDFPLRPPDAISMRGIRVRMAAVE